MNALPTDEMAQMNPVQGSGTPNAEPTVFVETLVQPSRGRTTEVNSCAALAPLLIGTKDAVRMAGVSLATWGIGSMQRPGQRAASQLGGRVRGRWPSCELGLSQLALIAAIGRCRKPQ